MICALPLVLLAPLVGLGVGGILALVLPGISRRRNLDRARKSGAVWVGMANFDALAEGQAPVIVEALSGVGALYGEFFSPLSQRPVGGLLSVFPEVLRWEPRIWLGRGHAKGWELLRTQVTGVDITKLPPPALRSFEATVHTTSGEIRFMVLDPDGLRSSLENPTEDGSTP